MGGKRRPIRRAMESFAQRADLPLRALADVPSVFIEGNRRITVDRHEGILEYGREEIRLSCGEMILSVKGKDLELTAMSLHEMAITGTIEQVLFS